MRAAQSLRSDYSQVSWKWRNIFTARFIFVRIYFFSQLDCIVRNISGHPRQSQVATVHHAWTRVMMTSHSDTRMCFCSELTMRTFAGLRTFCSACAEMFSKIILIWIEDRCVKCVKCLTRMLKGSVLVNINIKIVTQAKTLGTVDSFFLL